MPFTICPKCGENVCHPVNCFFCNCTSKRPMVKEVQAMQFALWSDRNVEPYKTIREVLQSVETLQTPEELVWLYNRLEHIAIKSVLEIGAWAGGTALLWEKFWGARVISIDRCPQASYAAYYCNLMKIDSDDPRAVKLALERNENKLFDMLFIDGDHTADGVKKDYINFNCLVRPGGVIVFHDIFWEAKTVGKFFTSLSGEKDWYNIYQGFGVLFTKEKKDAKF